MSISTFPHLILWNFLRDGDCFYFLSWETHIRLCHFSRAILWHWWCHWYLYERHWLICSDINSQLSCSLICMAFLKKFFWTQMESYKNAEENLLQLVAFISDKKTIQNKRYVWVYLAKFNEFHCHWHVYFYVFGD